jgi:hypothetical protein
VPGLYKWLAIIELTMKRNEQTGILHQGETAVIEPGVWHDWWNTSPRDVRVRVEITPGERFAYMIEIFFGLARLGHTDRKGMPSPLQLALSAREFSSVRSLVQWLRSQVGAAIARRTRRSLAPCSRRVDVRQALD